MTGRGTSSSSNSSSKKKKKSLPAPITIPRCSRADSHVPLSTSFTRADITRSVGRPDSYYPKVGDNESVNSLNGDFKFIPPHVIGQREREKEIARSYDKHHRRRYQHLY